ncbi:hypothetical protein XM38_007220 [Halomicronema hongdechloris C2206]|uniref:Uncharacterized protein n=1 Tax=Halomicronema hongdechloris C2206 TaxID=1641165 RepID=A0A1Z3HHP8_9CYAN|nr:hypothetical protein [Halomicronema hongdechloris]ASC69793.1 hypothetical protein XM38_007220 [Halomicronema hongdechloris C2206]
MTGFIRKLFGGKRSSEQTQSSEQGQGKAVFLTPDDAKTYGDIDYMRKAKTIKRTFARKKGVSEELESVRQISAMKSASLDANSVPQAKPQSPAMNGTDDQQESVQAAYRFDRRAADKSLDAFRDMARDLKKK